MLVHSHTLYSLCLGNIFAFECVKLANAWRGERQTASEQAHPSCLSVSCGWGRPAAMLPAISVSLIHIFTSSLLRHFKKKNDLLMLHRNGNKSGRATNQSSVLQHLETMLSAPYYFKLQTTRRSLPYNKCMGSCGFQPRPQLSYMEILERFR